MFLYSSEFQKEGSASPTDAIPTKMSPQDGPSEEQIIKSETTHPADIEMKSPDANSIGDADVKREEPMPKSPPPPSPPCAQSPTANTLSPTSTHQASRVLPAVPLDIVTAKPEGSPQKGAKKSGKRKRR